MDVVVVAHTHWDREWYHPAGRFRQRLVALVDELLDAPDDGPFLLDGQAIALDDYLSVRPDREPALRAALRTGAIEAGPWYVLADGLIPSGEALVRNLLIGRATLARFGAAPPPVLYCPDAFGHPAILPMLAHGFGCAVIIAWRGYGSARWPAGDSVWWAAPSGERALLHHLPRDGYETGSSLPLDAAAARARWLRLHAELAPRAVLGVTLLPSGADHHARQVGLAKAIDQLRVAAMPDDIRRGSLSSLAAALLQRAERVALPTITGELRDSYGYTWTLQGTFGVRAHQKRAAAGRDAELRWDAEPWIAAARALDLRPSLDAAWRAMLACHPHDTLCGCSIDDVARAMDDRLRDVRAQTRGLRTDALERLLGVDTAATRGRRAAWQPALVVRNAVPRPRGGVVEIELLATIADEPVGPGSGAGASAARDAAREAPAPPTVPGIPHVQLLGHRIRRDRVESARHYPDNDLVHAWRAVAWLPRLPPTGVRCFPLGDGRTVDQPPDGDDSGPRHPATASIHGEMIELRNGELAVTVDPEGRVGLTMGGGSVALGNLFGIEHQTDRGDLYTASLTGPVHSAWRCVGRSIVAEGPLRAIVDVDFTLDVPASRRRPDVARTIPVRVRLLLDADRAHLRVELRGRNRARDHRLRLVVRTGVPDATVVADAAFGPMVRGPIVVAPEDLAMETPPPTAPLHRHVSLRGRGSGVTIVSDGLAEYEVRPSGDVAITLVRAVGALSRAMLAERPGHAGWPAPTPLAQSRGPFAAVFAISLHPPGASDASARLLAERLAEDVLQPPRGETWRAVHTLPDVVPGPRLEGDGLVASAITVPAEGEGTILRCVNVLDQPADGAWTVPRAREAWTTRLDQTVLDRLVVGDGGRIEVRVPARGVLTLLVR